MEVRMIAGALALASALVVAGCGANGSSEGAGSSGAATSSTVRSTTTTTTSTTAATTTTAAPTTTTAAPTTTAPPTTTTAPPLTAPTWDQIKGAAIPALCTHDATTLVEGKDVTIGPNEGMFELLQTLPPNATPALLSPVPSNDAGPLTAVVASCNAGGVGWPNLILFFSSGGKYYGQNDLYEGVDWAGAGMNAPGRDGVVSLTFDGDRVNVYTSAETGSDPSCCPSTYASVVLHPESGRIIVDDVFEDIGD